MPSATNAAAVSGMPAVPSWQGAGLDARSLREIVALVDEACGVVMSDRKATLLETRLRPRLKANGLDDFPSYVALLRSPERPAGEMQAFIDCVVTNQTAFFREPAHFDHLTAAELRRLAESGPERSLRIWSAAAASGQEAYSLAMLAEEAARAGRPFPWSVLATDISLRMLRAARRGVYAAEEADAVPPDLRERYLRPGREEGRDLVRVDAALKRHVDLGRLNLMHETYAPGPMMDLILCRNVLIYFKPEAQAGVVARLCRHLRPGGLLILGHSESLVARDLPLRLLHSNIHERLEDRR